MTREDMKVKLGKRTLVERLEFLSGSLVGAKLEVLKGMVLAILDLARDEENDSYDEKYLALAQELNNKNLEIVELKEELLKKEVVVDPVVQVTEEEVVINLQEEKVTETNETPDPFLEELTGVKEEKVLEVVKEKVVSKVVKKKVKKKAKRKAKK